MKKYFALAILLASFLACESSDKKQEPESVGPEHKKVIYQVFTRLFGNNNQTNKPWGTLEENGVGKFNDFTDKALKEIKDLGVTHIWYTGVLHHAMVTDYTRYAISNDDPDIVKGRAGSPYAIKDYYNVDPDLAVDPSQRMEEFEALIKRTHMNDMKVIIDIVPNHIARKYQGLNNPEGVVDFGTDDDTSVIYKKNNNFYYIVGESFKVPEWQTNYLPLGGEKNDLIDGKFEEDPAKWTGNGSRLAQPKDYDWYETVKINYGIRPDGTKDFEELPSDFNDQNCEAHYNFWKNREVPDSWKKFRDITHFWLDKGVDGLRYDMAEMVPVEFWSYLNSSIKMKYPETLLLAEVYNPKLYRDYIHLGKMDYLYDKVGLYDSIKKIVQGKGSTGNLPKVQSMVSDIEHNMLHFLENHDEQRIASPEFAGSSKKGKPAMVVSTTLSTSPTLVYFAQELGEPGAENPGFGAASRTSIFDYVGVPHLQRWMNNSKYDGGLLSDEEKEIREFYKKLLNFTINSEALMGSYQEIHSFNTAHSPNYNQRVFSFVRWSQNDQLIIIVNFDSATTYKFDLILPKDLLKHWNIQDGKYTLLDQLDKSNISSLTVEKGVGNIELKLKPLESIIYQLKKNK